MSHHNYMFLAHCAIESIVRSSVQRCVPSNAITLSTNDCYETLMQICSVLHFLLTRKKIIIINNRTSRKEHECIYKIAFYFWGSVGQYYHAIKNDQIPDNQGVFSFEHQPNSKSISIGKCVEIFALLHDIGIFGTPRIHFLWSKMSKMFRVGNRGNPS